ncbi:MAG: 23S rRNA (adenine(2503)-C(2))-methyltransferase RlmN [Holophagales bacterium]|jgi:23S rRNA (adenine2503-C2)-methyltransferase|nr:23S rRNA (adenine(2503)-C(2))-methyltransferase RlmN [Holophagales bacterium]
MAIILSDPEEYTDRPKIAAPEQKFIANAADLGVEGLQGIFHRLAEPPYRAEQAFEGIYKHRWTSWQQFSNLPKSLRGKLEIVCPIEWPKPAQSLVSSDGSTKHAIELADGHLVECVYIPYDNRATMCISSQVGCAMGCAFCATGLMGFKRHLKSAEILGQVMSMLCFHNHPPNLPFNIVFMGMGEPLNNLFEVMEAFSTLTNPLGLSMPRKRVTVSTAGMVTGIKELAIISPRPRLAVSLNATTDENRSKVMPINKSWGLEKLADALKPFPLERGERITLEYVAIKGISDSMEDAARLSRFAGGFPSKINLIPFNPSPGLDFTPPSETRLDEMGAYLADKGHIVAIRRSRGLDVGGACGQLAGAGKNPLNGD